MSKEEQNQLADMPQAEPLTAEQVDELARLDCARAHKHCYGNTPHEL
jgi:hypothetical protein